MNKAIKRVGAVVCGAVIFSSIGCTLLNGCSIFRGSSTTDVDPSAVFKEKTGIELPSPKTALRHDDHGGLNGDGDTALIFTFYEEDGKALAETLSQTEHWQPAPFDPVTSTLLCNTDYKGNTVHYNTVVAVPEIEEGYYYFYDEQTSVYAPPENFIENSNSFNFRIAAFDSSTYTLYYYEVDT